MCRPACIPLPMSLYPLAAVLPGGCSGASLDAVPNRIGRNEEEENELVMDSSGDAKAVKI